MRSVFKINKIFPDHSKNFIYSLIPFLFHSIYHRPILPAYTDLLHTTYTREFDKNILRKYLYSNEKEKINAALLSIAAAVIHLSLTK
ncbi:MAG: hypothetical protein IPJ03_15660 [Ignavibacteriales bacterium]|nr:hypothetical protein [Ignavibacteriales bacterium]